MARMAATVGAVLVALVAAGGASAADVPEVDAELLEFLGSLDSDDEAWAELLAMAEAGKQSRAADEEKAGKVKDDEP